MQGVTGSNPLSSTRHNASAGLPLRAVCQQIVSRSLGVTAVRLRVILASPVQGVVATPRAAGVWMGRPRGWAAAATGRPPMRSPGRPPVARREHRQRFWKAIALGLSSEDAAVVGGVSQAVGPGGSVNVAACHRSVWPCCRAATCRSPSARRSPPSPPRAGGFTRSLGGWAGRRRRSRVSCAATPRPVAGCWRTGPRPPSGTPIGGPGAPSWPSSPPTTRCRRTCRTAWPA
jgi:hypothetical protein